MKYLIAHKAYGEPELDIAERVEEGTPSDPGPWWITLDGHRAYPVAWWRLDELVDISDYPHECPWDTLDKLDFSKVRDYTASDKSVGKQAKPLVTEINLEELGL